MDSLSTKEKKEIGNEMLEKAYESPVIFNGKKMTYKKAMEELFWLEVVYGISYVIYLERKPIEIEIIE